MTFSSVSRCFPSTPLKSFPLVAHSKRRRGEQSKRFIDPGCTSWQPSALKQQPGLKTLPETDLGSTKSSVLPPLVSTQQKLAAIHSVSLRLEASSQLKLKLTGVPLERKVVLVEARKGFSVVLLQDTFFTYFLTQLSLIVGLVYALRMVLTKRKSVTTSVANRNTVHGPHPNNVDEWQSKIFGNNTTRANCMHEDTRADQILEVLRFRVPCLPA